jgi:hypothetical protein
MSKELEDFRNTLNEYSSNEDLQKNAANFLENENLQKFLDAGREKFQEALAIPQAILTGGQTFRAGRALYSKVKNALTAGKQEGGSALKEAGFTEEDVEGSDMFDGPEEEIEIQPEETEMTTFKTNVEPEEEEDFQSTDIDEGPVDRTSFTDADPIDEGGELDELSSGLESTANEITGTVSDALGGLSEGVSTALTTASELLGSVGEVIGPISDIASLGILIDELVSGPSQAPPIPVVDVDTSNFEDLDVSASYNSVRNNFQRAIF